MSILNSASALNLDIFKQIVDAASQVAQQAEGPSHPLAQAGTAAVTKFIDDNWDSIVAKLGNKGSK